MSDLRERWGAVAPRDTGEVSLSSVRPSLVERARKRTVKDTSKYNNWIVYGDKKLGDQYDHYEVWFSSGKWLCSCQLHAHGENRQVCSHIVAVLIHVESGEGNGEVDWGEVADPVGVEVSKVPEVQGGFPLSSPASRDVPSMQDPMFGDPPFPRDYTTFRDDQWRVIKEILEHLENGTKVVMLSAPTGSGKTVIGEVVRRLWAGTSPSSYLCSTKTLQDQIVRDFPHAEVLKGKANYPTGDRVPGLIAADCVVGMVDGPQCVNCPTEGESYFSQVHHGGTYMHCPHCHPVDSCPYRMAKEIAVDADLSVLNYSYWMAETKLRQSKFTGRRFVIADEADTLEDELMRNVELVLTPGERKKLGVYTLPKKTVPADWVRWMNEDLIPAYVGALGKVKGELAQQSFVEPDPRKQRRKKQLEMRLERLRELVKASPFSEEVDEDGNPVSLLEDGWVLTGYEGNDYKDAYLKWKPVRVSSMAGKYLFDHASQWLLMSATLVSPEQMADDLGLDDWAVVEMGSTFPVGRRPIFVDEATVPMTYRTKKESWPKMVKKIDRCIGEHPGKRVLIHTVIYALTREIFDGSETDRMMTYWNAGERQQVLERFLAVDDAVLLAPSFERGVDLPGEDCEVIIVAKVPYPYMKDQQVTKRMYGKGGKQWYAVSTIRSIIQMTGRGMRSKDDWCEVYVFDAQFKKLYREWKRLFPRWWSDAVISDRNDPKMKRRLETV